MMIPGPACDVPGLPDYSESEVTFPHAKRLLRAVTVLLVPSGSDIAPQGPMIESEGGIDVVRGVTCLFFAAVAYFLSTMVGTLAGSAQNTLIGLVATIFFLGAAAAYGFTDSAEAKVFASRRSKR